LHKAWIGEDGDGEDEFAAPVSRRALVDLTKRLRVTKGGRTVMTFATLTFLDPVPDTTPNAGKVRAQPIDPRDTLTLPDGGTAPIRRLAHEPALRHSDHSRYGCSWRVTLNAPGRPHVKIHEGFVYIERVPNAWVQVLDVDTWKTLIDHEREFMVSKALKKGWDTQLPPATT
jgi:hypothetical protein